MSLVSHAYWEIFVTVIIDKSLAKKVGEHCHTCVGMTGMTHCMLQICMDRTWWPYNQTPLKYNLVGIYIAIAAACLLTT